MRINPADRATWIAALPAAWADESYQLATTAALEYCEWRTVGGRDTCAPIPRVRTLAAAYQRQFQPIAETRLQQAGARLADLLRRQLVVR